MSNAPSTEEYVGGFLDRLFAIRLPSGRYVSVKEVSLIPTNVGIGEGGLDERSNLEQCARIAALAEERHGGPVVVLEPDVIPMPEISRPGRPRERYPWMACMARLSSKPLDPFMLASTLTLVWWADELKEPLAVELARAAAALDWERSARDYDLW